MMPIMFWVKAGIVVAVLVVGASMTWYIKSLRAEVADLTADNRTLELHNTHLSETIRDQNESINISNAKYLEVQKQLDIANDLNKEVRKEFRNLRDLINKKPLPRTCEEANAELIEHGKLLGEKWKK